MSSTNTTSTSMFMVMKIFTFVKLKHDRIWGWNIYDLSTHTSWDRGRNGQWVVKMHLTNLWKAHLIMHEVLYVMVHHTLKSCICRLITFWNLIGALNSLQTIEVKCLASSLITRPRQAFRRLQYWKAWRAWYLFSHEHDVIGKCENFQNKQAAFHALFNWLHAQHSVYMTIALR